MIYIGIDVHKVFLQIAAMDEEGRLILNERVPTDHSSVKKFFARFTTDKIRCVMESSSVWYGLYMYMTEKLGIDVVLSNPYQTKAIAASKKKTDKIDAVILADLLRGDFIAVCYVPDQDIVDSRQLVRHRYTMVKQRTRYKNLIHGILLQKGVKLQGRTFTKLYTSQLKRLKDYRIDTYLKNLDVCNENIRAADIKIHAKIKESRYAQLLLTIPGVGEYTALTLAAEIGDITRFSRPEKLCSYAGIVPSVRNSADKVIHGRITKRGSNMMRWVLAEAVRSHLVNAPDSDITKFYKKISKKKSNGKATIAAAARMLTVMYYMLLENRAFITNYGQNRNGATKNWTKGPGT